MSLTVVLDVHSCCINSVARVVVTSVRTREPIGSVFD